MEAATQKETSVHTETAEEEATRQEILQRQARNEAGAHKTRERRSKLNPQEQQQARATNSCKHRERRGQFNRQEI